MKAPRRRHKFIARNYVKVLLPKTKKMQQTKEDFKGCKRVERHYKKSHGNMLEFSTELAKQFIEFSKKIDQINSIVATP